MSDFKTRKRYVNLILGTGVTVGTLFLLIALPFVFRLFEENKWTALAINIVISLNACYLVSTAINVYQRIKHGETEDIKDVLWALPGALSGTIISAIYFAFVSSPWALLGIAIFLVILAYVLWKPKKQK